MRQYGTARVGTAESLGTQRLTITVEQAAVVLGIGRGLAYALAASGSLPVVRLGRRMVVPLARLEALLEGDN
jgi:excisionase family DNA binding protein